MRSNKIFYLMLYSFYLICTNGCVNVEIGKNNSVRSTSVRFNEPNEPFKEAKSGYLDRAWKNTNDGSTISYLSDCYGKTDPSLEQIFKEATSPVREQHLIQQHQIEYNERAALHSVVEGVIDGVLTRYELVIFKKNHCNYILAYAATAESYATHQREFSQFVKGFKVK